MTHFLAVFGVTCTRSVARLSFEMFQIFQVILLTSALLFARINGEASSMIPLAKDGHAYHRGNTASLTTVEYFIDLTCSSCLDSWSTLSEVYDKYKDSVHFMYRVFPLPYHQQGFILAKAAQVVNAFGSSSESVFTFFDTAYANQPAIYNSATADMTYNEVVALVQDWAIQGTGVTAEQYTTGMNSSTTIGSTLEMNARYMWKYNTIQGIFATPLYQIDGLKVGGLDTVEDWTAALDPLLK